MKNSQRNNNFIKIKESISVLFVLLTILLSACTDNEHELTITENRASIIAGQEKANDAQTNDEIKAYDVINDNIPYFTEEERSNVSAFEIYSDLDGMGRCGVAYANICPELMPTEKRGEIGQIKPSGWHTVKYNDLIDGNYLYNRCHLIGYQLAGENANVKNLITGTRYLNVIGMLPFENKIADYVSDSGNHVLYRVRPVFEGDNLVADGVELEAWSVEDKGAGICFHVFCYNIQPGIEIDYKTGESQREYIQSAIKETAKVEMEGTTRATTEEMVWISDHGSKYHASSSCSKMKSPTQVPISQAISMGYTPCKKCN